MYNILVFAGTTEGRELIQYLGNCNQKVTACVATEYGETLIPHQDNLSVLAGRLDESGMEELFSKNQYDMVIDATHPYAQIVTENILSACQKTNTHYYRCLRESSDEQDSFTDYDKLICVENTLQAVEALNSISGNILLTTGSKELPVYKEVIGFSERIYPRVLPLEKVVNSCLELGVSPSHLIAMQGPFSEELNLAMIHQWNISCLVTKESGKAGGFTEKIAAAQKAGIYILMIGRPEEAGRNVYSLKRLIQMLKEKFQIDRKEIKEQYFPKFVSIKGKKVQVIGGGNIASRRIQTLLHFGAVVQVIAPKLGAQCQELLSQNQIQWLSREWAPGDCTAQMVLAATDNKEVNQKIVSECRAKGIEVNRCDCKEDCDFYFPAIVANEDIVVGLCSSGKDHTLVKDTAEKLRKIL